MSQECMNRIFVGGLPVRAERESIVEYFSQFGHIRHCKLKKNSKTGRFVGFAYITFENPQDTINLLQKKHVEFAGRVCEITQVFKSDSLKAEIEKKKRERILVWDLPAGCSNEELAQALEGVGKISHSYVVRESDGATSKGFGFVVFCSEQGLIDFCSIRPALTVRGQKVLYSSELQVPPKAKKEQQGWEVSPPTQTSEHHLFPLHSMMMNSVYPSCPSNSYPSACLESLQPVEQMSTLGTTRYQLGLNELADMHRQSRTTEKCSNLSAKETVFPYSNLAHILDVVSSQNSHTTPSHPRTFKLFGEAIKKALDPHICGHGREVSAVFLENGTVRAVPVLNEDRSNYRFNTADCRGSAQEQRYGQATASACIRPRPTIW